MPQLPLEIDVTALRELQTEGTPFLLLDVREPSEHATAKIEGAVLIPMRQITARLAELETHREGRIIVHCHHGGRSMQVTHYLLKQGFSQVQNLAGGIDAWSQAVDPAVPRY